MNLRQHIIDEIVSIFSDHDLYILTGDLGYNLLEPVRDKFPHRFINCGIAEQNMVSVAAGMAHEGLKVVVYSIAPFVSTRVAEQVKIDSIYGNNPIIILGAGSGASYGYLGRTHHCHEDLAIMTAIGADVICPSSNESARQHIKNAIENYSGTKYFRLSVGHYSSSRPNTLPERKAYRKAILASASFRPLLEPLEKDFLTSGDVIYYFETISDLSLALDSVQSRPDDIILIDDTKMGYCSAIIKHGAIPTYVYPEVVDRSEVHNQTQFLSYCITGDEQCFIREDSTKEILQTMGKYLK